jgi:hypothetical protein
MRERVQRIGGRLEVESEPGGGTAVSATVPALVADDPDPSLSPHAARVPAASAAPNDVPRKARLDCGDSMISQRRAITSPPPTRPRAIARIDRYVGGSLVQNLPYS